MPIADPTLGLMAAWADGWSVTRGCPTPEITAYGRYIQVGFSEHCGRHVVDEDASAFIPTFAAGVTAPWIFIKAFGWPDDISKMLPGGWSVEPPVWLMTTPLQDQGRQGGRANGYTATLTHEGALSVVVGDSEGAVGATGRAAVVGSWCVFDQIVTREGHRRRGLGTWAMHLLSERAAEVGAVHGLLVATDEGKALYNQLGWRLNGAVTSAVRRHHAPAELV